MAVLGASVVSELEPESSGSLSLPQAAVPRSRDAARPAARKGRSAVGRMVVDSGRVGGRPDEPSRRIGAIVGGSAVSAR